MFSINVPITSLGRTVLRSRPRKALKVTRTYLHKANLTRTLHLSYFVISPNHLRFYCFRHFLVLFIKIVRACLCCHHVSRTNHMHYLVVTVIGTELFIPRCKVRVLFDTTFHAALSFFAFNTYSTNIHKFCRPSFTSILWRASEEMLALFPLNYCH